MSRSEVLQDGGACSIVTQFNTMLDLYQVVELCAYKLNFGVRVSPLIFTKHMWALVKYLRQHAISVVIYLDDLSFVIEGSQAAVFWHLDFVDKTLCCGGLQRHPSKGQFQVLSQVLHDHLEQCQ